MEKAYNHKEWEEKIYQMWEEAGVFKPSPTGKPYTVLMPPPNANASLHAGHGMYTIDDIMIRWKRMAGYSALWVPGRDHAGFETQYVYEKFLAKEGKSRLDFDRETLYQNVAKFVEENSGLIFKQFKRLGLSADWERSVFTLDPGVVERVCATFKQMESEKQIYRDEYLVNYCTFCGTSLSELEVDHTEREDALYYIKYPLADEPNSFLTVATVRPETMFGDTAVAVHPKDKRWAGWVGKRLKLPFTTREIPIVADEMVEREFGTGAVKITPAHDPNDFAVGKKLRLKIISVIDVAGRMRLPEDASFKELEGIKVKPARELVVNKLKTEGWLEKIDEKYKHAVTTCYKCGRDLEPTIIPNWFIKVAQLKKPVIDAVKRDEVKFFPKKFKKIMLDWLTRMHDWPISRQIVWGIRIPVWYEINKTSNNVWVGWLDSEGKFHQGTIKQELENHALEEIERGIQWVSAATGKDAPRFMVSIEKPDDGKMYVPETNTFDTWFSSGQWPLVTLKPDEYVSRYPTDFMGTLEDILPFWISRMIMFGEYVKKDVPFRQVYLWSKVTDAKGQKMSKSKGNVVNPVELIDKYGADAVRMALVFGVAPGSNIPFSEDKIRGMRNFANKIWNMGRLLSLRLSEYKQDVPHPDRMAQQLVTEDKKILDELRQLIKRVNGSMEKFKFSEATEAIYEFSWHSFADLYLESIKTRKEDMAALSTACQVYLTTLKLLSPFMPFVTEAAWQEIRKSYPLVEPILMQASWPKAD